MSKKLKFLKPLKLVLIRLVGINVVILLLGCNIQTPSNLTITEKIKGKSKDPPIKVALLVPLESPSKSTSELAEHIINAAKLAVTDFPESNLQLSVYPTSGIEELAVKAAETALKMESQIIVGPLFSEETVAVREHLESQDIKIISLSNDPKIAGGGVFVLGTTFDTISDRLVKFAVRKRLNRIAIVGPAGNIGFNGISSVEKAIEDNGAIVSTISRYPLEVQGITTVAPSIFKNLVATDTQAIIFTDTPTRGLPFISEQIYRLFEKNKKSPPQFLGITRWDGAKQMLDEQSLDGGWFVIPKQIEKNHFYKRYIEKFGIKPTELSILSYDAIAIISNLVLKSRKVKTVDPFTHESFTDAEGFVTKNGIIRFDSNGTSVRPLDIVQVVSGSYKIIDID